MMKPETKLITENREKTTKPHFRFFGNSFFSYQGVDHLLEILAADDMKRGLFIKQDVQQKLVTLENSDLVNPINQQKVLNLIRANTGGEDAVTQLALINCQLSQKMLEDLMQALSQAPQITHLILSTTKPLVTDFDSRACAETLKALLSANKTLNHLTLKCADMNDNLANALDDALISNDTLVALTLENASTKISPDLQTIIEKKLTLNRELYEQRQKLNTLTSLEKLTLPTQTSQ